MGRKFGLSFSWKRAIGLSAAKARLSRQIGIPLTRYGRQRKVGRAMGCMVIVAVTTAVSIVVIASACVALAYHLRSPG